MGDSLDVTDRNTDVIVRTNDGEDPPDTGPGDFSGGEKNRGQNFNPGQSE